MLPQNSAMLRVFDDAGFEAAVRFKGRDRSDAPPRLGGRPRNGDLRDHVAVAASLRPFFKPASVAVIGASPRRGTIGGELFRNVLDADFTGSVYPVNRGGEPGRRRRGLRDGRRPADYASTSRSSVFRALR